MAQLPPMVVCAVLSRGMGEYLRVGADVGHHESRCETTSITIETRLSTMDQPLLSTAGCWAAALRPCGPPDIGPTRIRSRGRIRPFCSRAASLRHCRCWRLRAVEVAAYYVVAAWLANAAKHARASEVTVCAHMAGDHLRIPVQDDSPLNVGN